MKVILFGASGMVGRGVLRECLLDPDVEKVLAVGRGPSGSSHEKLKDLIHTPLDDLEGVKDELAGYDVCFFCLGVSSAGMTAAQYRKITYDLTLSVAKTLFEVNPTMTLTYVTGQGTGRDKSAMWAQVKGETEEALIALAKRAGGRAFMFRPGLIVPLHGIVPKTWVYRIVYIVLAPFLPLIRWLAPKSVATTEVIGRAMLSVGKRDKRDGGGGGGGGDKSKTILEPPDIIAAARGPV
jgi:uncharacterized protein YbjT (DUF2867 family)